MKYLSIVIIFFISISCKRDYAIVIKKHKDFQLNGLANSDFISTRNIFYNDTNAIAYLIKDSVVNLMICDEYGNLKNQIKIDYNVFKDKYYANIFSFLNYINNDSIVFITGEKHICVYKYDRYYTINLIDDIEKSYNLLSIKSSFITKINDSIVLSLISRKINQSTKEGRSEFFKYPPLIVVNLKKMNIKNHCCPIKI